jgi:glycosyltransferase involved in cell wall biosynthesis
VHDYLNQYGGAERVLEVMREVFPEAPVYTAMYDPDAMPDSYRGWDIRTTWIDALPGVHAAHQWALPLYPIAFGRLDLPDCDVVLSTSSAWAKLAQPPPGAVHVAYIHAPMRFAWNFEQYCEHERVPRLVRHFLPPFMGALRRRDRVMSSRVDQFVANSTAVRDRIRAFWRRDADVVYPPVAVERFRPVSPDQIEDYFLVVSRLVPYKRIDLVIEAFNALGMPLQVVGDGRARQTLERQAGPGIRFLGRVSDEEVRRLSARARAAVFMSEDDFGIAQVEVQAAGRPVIALARGGVLDSVIPDVTGTWVEDQSVEALVDAVRRFERSTFQTHVLVRHAAGFSAARFGRELQAIIERTMITVAESRQTRSHGTTRIR